jgi:spore coat polysaccharide biosynthesis predicted glycosyltransferase SpsG
MIRADATAETGAGHGMRCLTLAERWLSEARGPVTMMGKVEIPFVSERAAAIGVQRAGADGSADPSGILVVDSYDEAVRDRFSSAPARVRVLVDDIGCSVPEGYDVLWNPNAYGAGLVYDGFPGLTVAGADYVPVRDGLPKWNGTRDGGTLGTLGGAQLRAEVRDAFAALARKPGGGKLFAVGTQLSSAWEKVTSAQLWPVAATCARAVIGAGVTTWEFAAVGTPVVLVVLADNQKLIGDWAARAGVPVVDCRGGDSTRMAADLAAALDRARPLPRITDGSARFTARLAAAAVERQ